MFQTICHNKDISHADCILANVFCLYHTVGHLVWKIEEGSLEHAHEGDPLIEGGLGSLLIDSIAVPLFSNPNNSETSKLVYLLWSPIFLLHDAFEMPLIGRGDVGTAVDPAVVLCQV